MGDYISNSKAVDLNIISSWWACLCIIKHLYAASVLQSSFLATCYRHNALFCVDEKQYVGQSFL